MTKGRLFKILLPVIMVALYFFIIENNPYFSSKNFVKHIKTITSPEYKGRLTGNEGSSKTAAYLEKKFRSIGLSPLDKNGFIQSFTLNNIQLSGECSFKAFDARGNLLKEYKYGEDYKEMSFGKSLKGEVSGKISFNLDDKNPILLFKDDLIGEGENDYKLDTALDEKGIKAAIYPTSHPFRFRTPYKLQKEYDSGIVKIMISKNLSNEIKTFSKTGASFEIKTNTENKKVTGQNVIGFIKGIDSSLPPIILSAHYDHVGFDSDGTIYPGALDNASGTSFIIEAARVLKKSSPKRNIIIAAFDAEEVGLLGSKYFAEKMSKKLKGAKVINFDMVGSTKNIPLSVLSNTNNDLSKEVLDIMEKSNIASSKLLMDNSDHASFDKFGINAITLIHDDTDKIHTPYDTIKNIKEEKIIEVFHTLKSFLTYNDIISDKKFVVHENINDVNFYSHYILLSFITLAFLYGLIFIKRKG